MDTKILEMIDICKKSVTAWTHSGIPIKTVYLSTRKPKIIWGFFYLFLIFFTFSFPLLKKLKPAKTANESQTIKKAIFIVKIDDNIQNQIDHMIFQRKVANCSAQEISQILSFCACSVIIAETTGFITDKPKEIQNDTISIITNDKSNHNRMNSPAKNTRTTAMNNFLLNHSSRQETNKLNI